MTEPDSYPTDIGSADLTWWIARGAAVVSPGLARALGPAVVAGFAAWGFAALGIVVAVLDHRC